MLTEEEILLQIPGASSLAELFGYWPSFHDAEVISVELHRDSLSLLRIHTFQRTSEVRKSGHYKTQNHVIATFILEDIQTTDLFGFNQQNVISGLVIEALQEEGNALKLILGGCFGLEGSIAAKQIRIELEHAIPPGSIYLKVRD